MQELRLRAARTACARAQVTALRDRLLKLGVHVVVSVRRIVLHLPTSTPDLAAWRHIACALGARPANRAASSASLQIARVGAELLAHGRPSSPFHSARNLGAGQVDDRPTSARAGTIELRDVSSDT